MMRGGEHDDEEQENPEEARKRELELKLEKQREAQKEKEINKVRADSAAAITSRTAKVGGATTSEYPRLCAASTSRLAGSVTPSA